MAGLCCAFECPLRDGDATGRGAEAPHTAASRSVADTGAASFSLSFATNSAGVKYPRLECGRTWLYNEA